MAKKESNSKPMQPRELEEIRIAMGLSVASLARSLELDVVTIHNMRSSRTRIRQFVAVSIRCIYALWKIDANHGSIPSEMRGIRNPIEVS